MKKDQTQRVLTRILGALSLSAGLILGFTGCASSGPVKTVEDLTAVGLAEPFPNASMAQWSADYSRLRYDIPRAFKESHWGKMGLQEQQAADADGQPVRVIRAMGLLPDGRTATVVAWPVGDGTNIGVAVRVGLRGDRPNERAFLDALAGVLRGPISRQQRREELFSLP